MGYLQALRLEHAAQKLRKQGTLAVVKVAEYKPIYQMGYSLLDSIEGITLHNNLYGCYKLVKVEYKNQPEWVRYEMSYTPSDGEWLSRAEWWRVFLYEVLPPKQAASAMCAILRWYRHVIGRRKTVMSSKVTANLIEMEVSV